MGKYTDDQIRNTKTGLRNIIGDKVVISKVEVLPFLTENERQQVLLAT